MRLRCSIFIAALILIHPKYLFAEAIKLPEIGEVQKVALDYARIRPDELSDLKRRARRAAILPHLQIGAKRTIQNNIDIAINDNVSVTSNGTTIGPETSDIKQDANNDTAIEVKAVWNLNELIFNRDMLDVAEEVRYQMRERRQLTAEVNKLYFELQEILSEVKAEGFFSSSNIRRDRIVADMDALTGGWFSNQLNN